jgi:hypothetical protein
MIEQQIADHRGMYRDELDFSPSQRTPPVAYTYDDARRMLVPDDRPLVINAMTADEIEVPDSATQSTQVGVPMSGRMYRYLVGPTQETPWASSWKALRSWCRKNHRYHTQPPHWRGALCWELVNLTIVQGMSVYNAAAITQYDDPEPLLDEAFKYIEQQMDRIRDKQELRAREDEGRGPGAVPEPDRPCYDKACSGRPHFRAMPHPDNDEHVSECPTCRRRRAA